MEIGSKDKDSIIYCPYLPCKLIFLWKQKEFPYLGFAITNILKILHIYKFVGRFVRDILDSFYEKSPSFIAPYRIAYSIPKMAFAAFAIIILF